MTGLAERRLAELAEDPDVTVPPPEGSQRFIDDRSCVVIGPERRWASVSHLRLPRRPDELHRSVVEILDRVAGITPVTWSVGSSATPADLPSELGRLGLRAPNPPLDPVCAAMTLGHEPASVVDAVRVRRVATLEEHRLGLEIMLAAAHWTDRAATEARTLAEETYGRRTRRGGLQWLAWHRDKAVAWAMADLSPAGLFLAGGATLPGARGIGCYRALVRARWDESVRLGLGGLAVQAQHDTSGPILRRLGFTEVAVIHTLQS